jgi:excisionase family DNA binding protein
MDSLDILKGATAAATYTGLTRRAIYHLVENDRIPVKRVGRSLFFRKAELERVFSPGA